MDICFFKKFHFLGTIWSDDAKKLSTDSLEVSFQDSKIIFDFRVDFQFLWIIISRRKVSRGGYSYLKDFGRFFQTNFVSEEP